MPNALGASFDGFAGAGDLAADAIEREIGDLQFFGSGLAAA